MTKMTPIGRAHESAQINPTATRNMAREFGHGTIRRHEPNMLPIKTMGIRLGGRTVRPAMTQAREVRRDLVAGGNARNVVVRSANQNLPAVGLQGEPAWGLVGVEDAATVTGVPGWAKIVGVLAIGLLAARALR